LDRVTRVGCSEDSYRVRELDIVTRVGCSEDSYIVTTQSERVGYSDER
jgi:hypothetical protein